MTYDDDTQEIDMSKILSPAPNVVRVDFKPAAPADSHQGLKALGAQPWIWPMKVLAAVMILLLSLLML